MEDAKSSEILAYICIQKYFETCYMTLDLLGPFRKIYSGCWIVRMFGHVLANNLYLIDTHFEQGCGFYTRALDVHDAGCFTDALLARLAAGWLAVC